MADEMSTQFAPAERANPDDLARQCRYFSENRFFSELLHYVPDMVMILNRQRQIVCANRAALDRIGAADQGSVLGLRPGEAFHCKHAEETDSGCGTTRFCRYCGAVNAILQSQFARFVVEECRMTIHCGQGEESLDLRVWATPIELNQEQFTFFAVADIADEKRRRFLERVFLHDMMNTAVALRAFSSLTTDSVGPSADLRDQVGRISFLCERIFDEMESYSLLMAAENGEITPNVNSVDALQLMKALFDVYNRREMLNGRFLEIDAGSDRIELQSDPKLLYCVLENMVKNALEGSAPGETVLMGCRLEASQLTFWVHNPTYMPENIRLQVFNRSFSTKGVGRGLGTYSLKYLTEKYLAGRVGFTSSESEGTTFTATYPLEFPRERLKPAVAGNAA